jgi:hypothetical protein
LLGFFISTKTTLYLSHEDYTQHYVDYLIRINDTRVFEDSVSLGFIGLQKKEVKLRMGINKIEVSSYNNEVYKKKYIFYLYSQYLFIDNLPECGQKVRCVHIDTGFRPYIIE